MSNEKRRDSFLFKNGGYIIYLIFLIGLFFNGGVAIIHFRNGQWLLGIWALFSVLILPKAILGLILIVGHKSRVFMNMPPIIWKMFRGTMQRYRSDSLMVIDDNPLLKGFIKETVWLGISIFPIIIFLFLQ